MMRDHVETGRGAVLLVTPVASAFRAQLAERWILFDLAGEAALPRARSADIVAVITSGRGTVPPSLIDTLPNLRIVAVNGVGYDRIDVPYCRARGIVVTNTPDVLTDDVADLALGLLIAASRRIVVNDRSVRRGDWARGAAIPYGRRVSGQRVGIIGLGRIGAAFAKRVEPIAGEIAYHNRRRVQGVGYRYYESAARLAEWSDSLVLFASSPAGEPPIVGGEVLDALGREGIFVNVARGHAVDETALIAALAEGRIGAAALDVFASEPHVPTALIEMDNVVLQPHQASATSETRAAMGDLVIENIRAVLAGEAPRTPV